MKKRNLGRAGLSVSEIGLGALEIGRAWGLPIEGDFAVPSEREADTLLDRALELGINLIDTAPAYMLSEERIGKHLKNRRKEFYLASKCGESFDGYGSRHDFSKAGTLRFIESSLKRLQTDYLDVIQIHCGPDEVATIRRGEVVEGMLRAKEQGKVRWIGASCGAEGAGAALDTGAYDVLQLPYSLLNRVIEHGNASVISRAAQANVGIIVREPLERGKLTEKISKMAIAADPTANSVRAFHAHMQVLQANATLSGVAIQFVLRLSEVSTVLVGTRNPRHLEEAVRAADQPLDSKLLAAIDALADQRGSEAASS